MNLTADDNRFLKWIERKHEDNDVAFRKKLVANCRAEFLCNPNRDENTRADIYARLRADLELPDINRLRRHELICCCS